MGMILPEPVDTALTERVERVVPLVPVVEPEKRVVTTPDTGPQSRARGSVVTLDPPKRTK